VPSVEPQKSEIRFRVRYAETDQMGVVYHANYIIWFELARTEFCRARGIRYADIERVDGLLLVVAEAHCRYRQPARYDDEIIATGWIEKAHSRMIVFSYEIRRAEDGALLATGSTHHIFLRDGRPVKVPEKFHALFGLTE
jgi:acyl-CoA thioester hydrolase